MKKLITLLLTFTLLSSAFVNAYALEEDVYQDEEIIEGYQYTQKISSFLTYESAKATCRSTITGLSCTKIVVTQKLQKKSGDSWTTVNKWEKTYSASTAVYSNNKSSLSSGTYRTRTVAKVYKGSNYETVSANSTSVKIK